MKLTHIITSIVLLLGLQHAALAENRVVYHINDSTNAAAIVRNAYVHLDADPKAKIAFVAYGRGIDFLLEGAADREGKMFAPHLEKLIARGVEIRVCNDTLISRKIDPKSLVKGAIIVPSGVSEIARLQAMEGYGYIKP